RSRPLSDRLRPSPDAPRSLARCAAVAIRVVPGQLLVVFSLRSRRCSYRRRLHAYVEINVPDLILVGRFSSDPHWPVLGDRWGPHRHGVTALRMFPLAKDSRRDRGTNEAVFSVTKRTRVMVDCLRQDAMIMMRT